MPMLKKLLKFIVLILVLVGVFYGIMLTIEKSNPEKQLKRIEYYIYGKKHRENGPAVIEWSINGEVIKEEYWLNGKRLNELQIAVLKGDDNKNE